MLGLPWYHRTTCKALIVWIIFTVQLRLAILVQNLIHKEREFVDWIQSVCDL
jgi:hypothetical protein